MNIEKYSGCYWLALTINVPMIVLMDPQRPKEFPVGFVNHDKVALYHKASDVMVSVSKYDSGPVALQEAMACGDVPIISDLPCVREWIDHDQNGILTPAKDFKRLANEIIELLENNEKRSSFVEKNLKLIEEKGDQNMWMKKVEKLYYGLIDDNR